MDLFHYFDVDGDGVITAEDLCEGLKQLGNFPNIPKVERELMHVVVNIV